MKRAFAQMAMWLLLLASTPEVAGSDPVERKWTVGDPVLSRGPTGTFSEVSVKDPSIVHFEGRWHLFFTALGPDVVTTGYVSAEELSGLAAAPRHDLTSIRQNRSYACAPQVLYYRPQGRWYLIFQNLDARYQPAFSTTTTISGPGSWTPPAPLVHKDTKAKWIDFWVICDEAQACLFYTQSQSVVMLRTTSLDAFPNGWSKAKKVFDGVTEAVHVYKVKGRNEYHMIYELNRDGIRSFGLATAKILEPAGDSPSWTEMVSHGEAIRTGYDQRMEYDPEGCRWLIQGILKRDVKGDYGRLPWRLGIIRKKEPAAR